MRKFLQSMRRAYQRHAPPWLQAALSLSRIISGFRGFRWLSRFISWGAVLTVLGAVLLAVQSWWFGLPLAFQIIFGLAALLISVGIVGHILVLARELLSFMVDIYHSVTKGKDAARQELEDRGIDVTQGSLLTRVRAGDLDVVELLLNAGIPVDCYDLQANRRRPLHIAVRHNHIDVVELLLSREADPDCRDGSDVTPLMWACHEGHTEIISLLLNEDADINARNAQGGTAVFALAHHGRLDLLEIFSDQGAELNAQTETGATPLMCACLSRENDRRRDASPAATVGKLLSLGADPTIGDNCGATAIHYALFRRAKDVVEVLEHETTLVRPQQRPSARSGAGGSSSAGPWHCRVNWDRDTILPAIETSIGDR